MAELLAFLDLEKTRFTKRIFSLFDEDGSGLVDFREFVMSLWNYCTLTKVSTRILEYSNTRILEYSNTRNLVLAAMFLRRLGGYVCV